MATQRRTPPFGQEPWVGSAEDSAGVGVVASGAAAAEDGDGSAGRQEEHQSSLSDGRTVTNPKR